jgi:hypothetical protein
MGKNVTRLVTKVELLVLRLTVKVSVRVDIFVLSSSVYQNPPGIVPIKLKVYIKNRELYHISYIIVHYIT